jgi:hypothetical protein
VASGPRSLAARTHWRASRQWHPANIGRRGWAMPAAPIGRQGIIGPMRRRSRTRRVLKWAGLVACVVIVAAWAVSLTQHVGVGWTDWRVSLSDGQVWLWRLHNVRMRFDGWHVYYDLPRPRSSFGMTWVPRFGLADGGTAILQLPLWFIVLVAAIPTALLWYRDSPPPKGCCRKCGYDLTGNVSGVCPECGKPFDKHRSP